MHRQLAVPRLIGLLLAAAALCACADQGPSVELGGKTFYVEIADTPQRQQLGLMFRDELAENAGMIFVNDDDRPRAFHMQNCRIPLDIIFFDKDLRLVNAHVNVPPCRTSRCPSYRSEGPARYILELNGGTFPTLGLGEDATLTLKLD